MKLINLLSQIISEQPAFQKRLLIKGLVLSEMFDGNIFELYTYKHGVDRAIRKENISEVTKYDIIDKFTRAIPELNKRFFGKIRNAKSPIIDNEYIFRDFKSGSPRKEKSPKFVVVEQKDDFFQMVLMVKNYDKNSNYISFDIVTILKSGEQLYNLYNPQHHVLKYNIFLEHVGVSEIIHIFV